MATADSIKRRKSKHGHSREISGKHRSRTYESWQSMKKRCLNPNVRHYSDYGGRGITVCDRWLKFENFLSDMGEAPDAHSIGRINNDGNYELSNCRWETQTQQANNRRVTVYITFNGFRKTASEWAKELGMKRKLICQRLKAGFPIDECLFNGHLAKLRYPTRLGMRWKPKSTPKP